MAVLGSKAESKLAIWCYFGVIAAIAFNEEFHKGKITHRSGELQRCSQSLRATFSANIVAFGLYDILRSQRMKKYIQSV